MVATCAVRARALEVQQQQDPILRCLLLASGKEEGVKALRTAVVAVTDHREGVVCVPVQRALASQQVSQAMRDTGLYGVAYTAGDALSFAGLSDADLDAGICSVLHSYSKAAVPRMAALLVAACASCTGEVVVQMLELISQVQ
jgi:hypothetical protein